MTDKSITSLTVHAYSGASEASPSKLTQAEEGKVVLGMCICDVVPAHGLSNDVVHHLYCAPLPEDDLLY